VSDETYQAHRGDGLFQREENSARRFLIIHVAAFDLHDDFAPFVLGFVEIQQAVHAVIRAFSCAFTIDVVPRPGTVARMSEPMASKGHRSGDKGSHGKN